MWWGSYVCIDAIYKQATTTKLKKSALPHIKFNRIAKQLVTTDDSYDTRLEKLKIKKGIKDTLKIYTYMLFLTFRVVPDGR